ncbi:MAG: hypothetical protein HY763_07810 [Planctomycetes bacterium]|nr:hypothetical protein [Planctomycetota bacterium]
MSLKTGVLAGVGLLGLGCLSAGLGRQPAEARPAGAQQADRSVAPLALPYHGYGTVDVLDDGLIVVEIGGRVLFDPDAEDGPVIEPSRTIAYRVDPHRARLVRREAVLVVEGVVPPGVADLSDSSATITTFRDPAAAARPATRHALVTLSGDLSVALTDSDGSLSLSMVDQADHGWTLALSGRLVRGANALHEVSEAADAGAADPGSGPGLFLYPAEAESSACSVECRKGAANINCNNKGCACWCSNGVPRCRCIDHS